MKLWSIINWKCLTVITDTNSEYGYSFSSIFFNEQGTNNNYIITSSIMDDDPIKIWDLKSNFLGEINGSKGSITNFIESYDDEKMRQSYILSANENYCESFNFQKRTSYKKYQDKDSKSSHYSLIVSENKDSTTLIECSDEKDYQIRVWDFHSAELLKKIGVGNGIKSICKWKEDYIIGAGNDNSIKLINNQNGNVENYFAEQEGSLICVRKICLKNLGECLLSFGNDRIILWKINN